MYYSQIYNSIRQVYRGFCYRPYYTLTLSLPLIMSLQAAHASGMELSNGLDSSTLTASNVVATHRKDTSAFNALLDSKDSGIEDTDIQSLNIKASNLHEAEVSTDFEQFTDAQTDTHYNGANKDTNWVVSKDDISLKNAVESKLPSENSLVESSLAKTKALATSFNTDSVQDSLARLAEFYQLSTADLHQPPSSQTDAITSPPVVKNAVVSDTNLNSTVLDSTVDNTTTNIVNSAPTLAPNLYNSHLTATSSQRCEGIWVTPKTTAESSEYTQAIRRAQQNDGLDIGNGLPLYTQANYAYYDNKTYLELSGQVTLVQNGQLVNAEHIVLDLASGIANIKGDVLLVSSGANAASTSDPNTLSGAQASPPQIDSQNSDTGNSDTSHSDIIVVAEELAYNTNTAATTAHDVAFASIEMQAHGYAKTLNKPDATHLELEKVMFSTCPPANRKWQLEAENIDIDTESGRGTSYNTLFRLGGVPVFYLPYFEFPVDDRRSSGLLTPSASLDSESGLQISVPYYLNLAPNYDATVTADIFTNKNPMITTELRYLTDNYGQGDIKATYLPNDRQYNHQNRHGLFYHHSWTPEAYPRLSADVVYNYVSDSKYLDDFDSFGTTDSHLNLPRRAQINYYNDYLTSQLKVETFQSLDATDAEGNPVQDKDKPYSRLPQLSINYTLPSLKNFVVAGVHDSAYFKKSINDGSENEKSGLRVYNKVGASYPLKRSWGHITPAINFHYLFTAYDEESRIVNNVSSKDNTKTAFVPEFSIDSALNFYQAGSPLGLFDDSLGGYQLLTPRLKYTYADYKDQSEIPNFNTRIASYDYDQLFADSRFLGYDRIPDNNNVTLGVDYRYIDAMGVTRFDGSIGNQLNLDDIKVTLDETQNLDTKRNNAKLSGLAWRSSIQPYRNLWFDLSGALKAGNQLNFISSQLRYQPTPLSLINLGIVERKKDILTNQSALSAFTASTIIPFNNQWRFMAQSQFDNRNHKFIDSTLGIGFEDCCYGFSVYGRSYYNDLNFNEDPKRAVMFEFRINGLGDNNSRFSRLLSNKILGFEPIDELWNGQ